MPAPRSRYSEHTMKVLGRSDGWIRSSCSRRKQGPRPDISFDERFGTLKELMRVVDLVTSGEREQVMSKMLIILRREALGLDSPIAAADLASLSNAMTELEHEAGRTAPAPGVFNRHVEVAVGALRRAAIVPASPRPSALAETERFGVLQQVRAA
jgi:hypothetical protein